MGEFKYLLYPVIGSLTLGFHLGQAIAVSAQIAPDQTLSTPTRVAATGLNFSITQGTQVGRNLFHSFAEFSVPTGGSAFFNNASTVQNIIARVTGSNLSSIDGSLRANGAVNFWLINPNGISFSSRASLVGLNGSFIATTASSLKLSNGDEFSASFPQSPLLTIAAPIGLQFGRNPAAIQTQNAQLFPSPLATAPTLALIGGDVTISRQSTLLARGGQVELGSVGPNSFVSLTPTASSYVVDYSGVQAFGNIQIQQSFVGSSLSNSVRIRGQQVTLDNRAEIALESPSGQNSGGIRIQADRLTIRNNSTIQTTTRNNTPGGNIVLDIGQALDIQGTGAQGSRVLTQSQGGGKGGDLTIQTGTMTLRNSAQVGSNATRAGTSGNVVVQTNRLQIESGASISALTFGSGSGGNLTVNATDSIQLIGTRTLPTGEIFASGLSAATAGAGSAGTLTINTPRLLVQDGGNVSGVTEGAGQGGRLTVNAAEIWLSGFALAPDGTFRPSAITTLTTGRGAGGILTINTGQLAIQNDTQVSASTLSSGEGGSIIVNAAAIDLTGTANPGRTGLFARSRGSGNAGQLIINTGALSVQDQAQITVSGESTGNAGSLTINARSVQLNRQGRIVADAASAQGGNIELQVSEFFILRNNSQISTSAGRARGGGDGGNITIRAPFIIGILSENSDITANAFTGRGGNINITTNTILGLQRQPQLTPLSDITASSQFGLSGTVVLNTLNFDPSAGLQEIKVRPVDPSRLIAQSCNSGRRTVEGQSRFVRLGRGGFSANPDDPFGGSPLLDDLGSASTQPASATLVEVPVEIAPPAAIVEAQSWLKAADGNISLVAQSGDLTSDAKPQLRVQCQEL